MLVAADESPNVQRFLSQSTRTSMNKIYLTKLLPGEYKVWKEFLPIRTKREKIPEFTENQVLYMTNLIVGDLEQLYASNSYAEFKEQKRKEYQERLAQFKATLQQHQLVELYNLLFCWFVPAYQDPVKFKVYSLVFSYLINRDKYFGNCLVQVLDFQAIKECK